MGVTKLVGPFTSSMIPATSNLSNSFASFSYHERGPSLWLNSSFDIRTFMKCDFKVFELSQAFEDVVILTLKVFNMVWRF